METDNRQTDTAQLWLVATAVAALIALAGCSGDLPLTSQLERTRVVGARVVTSEAGRADVAPGETAAVEWLVLGPKAPTTVDWAFGQCRALAGNCVDQLTSIGQGSGTPISVPFTAPAADALTDGHVPLLLGAVCADGTLGLDAATQLPTCTGDGSSGTTASYVVPFVTGDATPNRHPNLGNDRIDLGDIEWTTPVAGDSGAPCDGSDGTPVVVARPDYDDDAKVALRITTDGDDRESYTPPMETAPTLEELQFSLFATAGKFETSYLAIFKDDTRPNADVTVKWEPPKAAEVPAGGLTVQFHFVMRDLRGGLDLTHRTMCMVAP